MIASAKTDTASLSRLARLYGIQASYYANRRRVMATPEALIGALSALGADISSPDGAPTAIRERESQRESRVIEPVYICWDGAPGRVPVRTGGAHTECTLRQESGEASEWRLRDSGAVALPALPFGYHRLTVHARGAGNECLVISAPSRACSLPSGAKVWGVFMPLYSLRSRDDSGAGDLADLARLAGITGRLGGTLLATLPLMSAFLDEPCDPSPYAPASRLFWNEFYVSLDRIPELESCAEARDLIASPAFQREMARLRATSLVDYRGVMRIKRSVLSLLALSLHGQRLDAFERFVSERPALQDYARFRAAVERYRAPWHEWPEPARSGAIETALVAPAATRYHEYVQWIAEEQLAGFRNEAAEGGLSLYFDLPLGASRESFDVWRNRRLFAEGASVGAPPDSLFPQGQDWTFPPPHPDAVRANGYAHQIAVLRQVLRFAGAVRIDHVMGLHRLYWVPQGTPAAEGVYVHYHADEMYAILCLESHRHRTAIVGEDLGTVPPYVRTSLGRHNIYRMHVLQFETSSTRLPAVRPAPARAIAALNTHDTPSFAAWLESADIDDAERLGFFTTEAAVDARTDRQADRQALTGFLQHRGLAPAAPTSGDLMRGALGYLAASRSRLMLVNLEDLWLEVGRQNIPGTNDDQHPNWRRKAARTLEEIEGDAEVNTTLLNVHEARTAGSNG
ncbi:MAG TPA: 4-alpha-glucanotransferase [Dehalococcoidia bacterium]|nr:4-alpha-glucanotransferase [Dehalococcoidia bacterium]